MDYLGLKSEVSQIGTYSKQSLQTVRMEINLT